MDGSYLDNGLFNPSTSFLDGTSHTEEDFLLKVPSLGTSGSEPVGIGPRQLLRLVHWRRARRRISHSGFNDLSQ